MVAHTQSIFQLPTRCPVIQGAGKEHEKHAHDEEQYPHRPFPSTMDGRRYHPYRCQREDDTNKMGEGITPFVFFYHGLCVHYCCPHFLCERLVSVALLRSNSRQIGDDNLMLLRQILPTRHCLIGSIDAHGNDRY